MLTTLSVHHPEFIYCGRTLSDDQTLAQQRIQNGSTIHVIQRPAAPAAGAVARTEVQESDIMAAVAALRKVTAQLSLARSFSPAVIRDVLEEYPEFHTELGAQAILRQLLLWSKIGKIDTARRIAETYPILILSAPFVVSAFRKHGGAPGRDIDAGLGMADGLAPTDEDAAAAPSAEAVDDQRLISRHQLASALMRAGSGPGASAALAEALARMDSQDEQHAASVAAAAAASAAAAGPSASTSNASASSTLTSRPSDVTADPNAAASSARISSQAFNNAMRGAYRSTARRSQSIPTAAPTPDPNVPLDGASAAAAAAAETANIPAEQESARVRYRAELMIMREMGLTDDVQNVSALIVCNGNVEGAIDLVLLSGLA